METPYSTLDDTNESPQHDIITISYYAYSLFTESPYLVMSSMIDSDKYRDECSSYDSKYLTTTPTPWISLSEEMQSLIKKELQYMFFEETAFYLRSADEYAIGWYATSDLPVARYRHPAQVSIDRDEMFKFLNKEIAVYIDTDTVGEMDLGYLGRYLYRAWLHLHQGRPPFQRGGFFAKPLRISKKHTGTLDTLSLFHGDLTRTLSLHLDDPVQFEQGRDHSTITPTPVSPSVQSLKDHGYLIRPLFRAIYMVADDQSLADYNKTPHVSERENRDWMAHRSQFRANQVSSRTVLLVKTGDDSHLSSPISFLPLFDAGLALNVNRKDYQDEEEPKVVRIKIDDAISFIWDILMTEMNCKKEAVDLNETLRQEQDMHCQAWISKVVEHAQEVGIDTNGYSWQAIRRALARINNEAFDGDQVSPYWETMIWWKCVG